MRLVRRKYEDTILLLGIWTYYRERDPQIRTEADIALWMRFLHPNRPLNDRYFRDVLQLNNKELIYLDSWEVFSTYIRPHLEEVLERGNEDGLCGMMHLCLVQTLIWIIYFQKRSFLSYFIQLANRFPYLCTLFKRNLVDEDHEFPERDNIYSDKDHYFLRHIEEDIEGERYFQYVINFECEETGSQFEQKRQHDFFGYICFTNWYDGAVDMLTHGVKLISVDSLLQCCLISNETYGRALRATNFLFQPENLPFFKFSVESDLYKCVDTHPCLDDPFHTILYNWSGLICNFSVFSLLLEYKWNTTQPIIDVNWEDPAIVVRRAIRHDVHRDGLMYDIWYWFEDQKKPPHSFTREEWNQRVFMFILCMEQLILQKKEQYDQQFVDLKHLCRNVNLSYDVLSVIYSYTATQCFDKQFVDSFFKTRSSELPSEWMPSCKNCYEHKNCSYC